MNRSHAPTFLKPFLVAVFSAGSRWSRWKPAQSKPGSQASPRTSDRWWGGGLKFLSMKLTRSCSCSHQQILELSKAGAVLRSAQLHKPSSRCWDMLKPPADFMQDKEGSSRTSSRRRRPRCTFGRRRENPSHRSSSSFSASPSSLNWTRFPHTHSWCVFDGHCAEETRLDCGTKDQKESRRGLKSWRLFLCLTDRL